MINKTLFTATVLTLAMLVSGGVMAKHHGERSHKGGWFARAVQQLELNDSQQQQIKQIRMDSKKQLKALHQQGRDSNARQAMFELIKAEDFNEQQFLQLHQRQADMKAEMALIKSKSMHQVYHLLTPAQQQELLQMMAKHQQRKRDRHSASNN
ncbi:Spy/CpxP family protein refolding chaperone [Thalassotalea maritima]|uniref:Spy/CpxP family protein refolding chaperone n=1 Tax=Thalassotalea maritima TaxID=3242416 RepID=UPI0035281F38